jgi:hypothetical protein
MKTKLMVAKGKHPIYCFVSEQAAGLIRSTLKVTPISFIIYLFIYHNYSIEGSKFESWQGQEFSPRRPDRFCGPLNLLSNGYRELLPQG